MTRFTNRVERDLGQIADRATPSSTAWEAIQHRIDEQATEPTMEIIMLSPDRIKPPTRSRTWMLVAASVAAAALIAGLILTTNRNSDDQVPADRPNPTVPAVDPDATPTSDPDAPQAADPVTTVEPDAPPAVAPATTVAANAPPAVAPATTVAANAPPAVEPATTPVPATLTDVKVYFLRGERLVVGHRLVPGPAVLRGALTELLAGPTDAERAAGLVSALPAGTELVDVKLVDGVATVDLSAEFESGGGSLSMTARVAQIVFTATQFENADGTLFRLNGQPISSLGGEGLVLTEPQARMDVDRSLSGGVIIDAPAYGATVGKTFTVTGEADVFEAQFPIEVWANGVQIGGLAPVTGGAWGTWGDFEVTITLDGAAPGPIELVAYDAGGCGDAPECPPIIRTVVPLTLAG